jgi:ATP-dependent helicase/nuclease subunit B
MPAPVTNNTSIHNLAYGQDCLAELASHIIREHKDKLPNLVDITVLLSSPQAAIQLRKLLLKNAQSLGFSALLGPAINTLPNWASQLSHSDLPVLTEHQRELMLVEALKNHSYLYGKASPWTFADSLLELFDELNERQIRLPEKFEDFLQQLGDAYESNNDLINNPEIADTNIKADGLSGEALLVHTLWQAWQQQMEDEGITDRHTNYLLKLTSSQEHIQPNQTFYIAGFSQFSPAETAWLISFMKQGKVSLWLQGSTPPIETIDYHPDCATRQLIKSLTDTVSGTMGETIEFPEAIDDYGIYLNSVFDTSGVALQERAQSFAEKFPSSPVTSRLSLIEAKSAEQEAMAIDLQTRLWWLEGKHKIGIVTENRRLARRVRALLERSGIELQDAAGWALSTTSAAATLERWLEAVEEDFAYQPLLDLLKSPFFQPKELFSNETKDQNRESLLATIYRFEKSVVLKENVGSNLERYRQHTQYRQNR